MVASVFLSRLADHLRVAKNSAFVFVAFVMLNASLFALETIWKSAWARPPVFSRVTDQSHQFKTSARHSPPLGAPIDEEASKLGRVLLAPEVVDIEVRERTIPEEEDPIYESGIFFSKFGIDWGGENPLWVESVKIEFKDERFRGGAFICELPLPEVDRLLSISEGGILARSKVETKPDMTVDCFKVEFENGENPSVTAVGEIIVHASTFWSKSGDYVPVVLRAPLKIEHEGWDPEPDPEPARKKFEGAIQIN